MVHSSTTIAARTFAGHHGSAGVALAHHSCPQLPVQSCLHNLAALLSPLLSFLCKLLTCQLFVQVTKVCVTTLVSNTYHAAIHLARAVGRGDPTFQEVQVDSRPSGERCPPAGPLIELWFQSPGVCQQV